MKILIGLAFILSPHAYSALGEQCTTAADPLVIEALHAENQPSCFVESNTGQPTVAPFTYKNYVKASIGGSTPRNANMNDFFDNSMVLFRSDEGEHGYFWPYDDVRKKSATHYQFNQSGNKDLRTDVRVTNVGPLKRIMITSRSYTLGIICADQNYFSKCANPAIVNASDRSEVKDVPAASIPAVSNSSGTLSQ